MLSRVSLNSRRDHDEHWIIALTRFRVFSLLDECSLRYLLSIVRSSRRARVRRMIRERALEPSGNDVTRVTHALTFSVSAHPFHQIWIARRSQITTPRSSKLVRFDRLDACRSRPAGRMRVGWTARAGRCVRGPAVTLIERALINHLNVTRDTAANPSRISVSALPVHFVPTSVKGLRPVRRASLPFYEPPSRGRAHNYVCVPK